MKLADKLAPRRSSESGSATVFAAFAVVILLGITGAMLSMTVGTTQERNASGAQVRAFAAANSGMSEAIANLRAGVAFDASMTGGVATDGEPNDGVRLNDARYWTWFVDNGDGTFTVTSTGGAGGAAERVQSLLSVTEPASIYDNAVFAGNSSGDANYVMEFGGVGAQADDIGGDVYSGGGISSVDDALIAGTPRAAGTVAGVAGESGVNQPIVDLAGMSYETTADFDVASLFAGATFESDALGGNAWQVPEENPAHIFRLNPDDRTTETSGTAKDDYFLEDPYESVNGGTSADGHRVTNITVSGTDGNPGKSGNQAVYYIDGNLWLHNKPVGSFQFYQPDGTGIQVTIVVKGNIYISDDLYRNDEDLDGIALIAMTDDKVADSGNIYFGDPRYGTLEEMHSYMYAENNFHDQNLDASGSAVVRLEGNMTAGNQVLIERDFGGSHTRLEVEFDDRVSSGKLGLPGLPQAATNTDTARAVTVLAWSRAVLDDSRSVLSSTIGGGVAGVKASLDLGLGK